MSRGPPPRTAARPQRGGACPLYLPLNLAQASISGRSQRRARLGPRSTTGRGISGYRCRYVLTLLGWARPRRSATSLSSAGSTVRILSQLSAWCLSQGMSLDWEVVLDPDTVERFVSVGIKDDRCRGTYRSALRRLGPLLTSKAPWEPRAEAVNRRRVAVPYSTDELELLWRDAQLQATAARLRAGQALIALGAGAGLDGRWSTRVAAEDVTCRDGIVFVRVGDPSARTVPVFGPVGAGRPRAGCVGQ